MTTSPSEVRYRLRIYPFRPGVRNRIEEGMWGDGERFAAVEEAAHHRQKLQRPLHYRVVREVDGKPQELTREEAQVVNGVEYRDELDRWLAEQRERAGA